MKKCINPYCRRKIPDYCVFCMYCGTKWEPQKSKCPHCGFDDVPDIALFCPNCGKKLDDSQHPDNREVPVADTATASNGLPPVLQRLVDNMVLVQGGTFMMGATPEQARDAYDNENPAHQVTLSTFRIGKFPVTQQEWEAVMGRNPSQNIGDNLPVENVSWHDCQEFIAKLNEMTGKTFRLPTEAEWEFAARGGRRTKGFKYSGSDDPDEVAWHEHNAEGRTHPVGQKKPNELGLYDMSGNVCEWCSDWWGRYGSSPATNPQRLQGAMGESIPGRLLGLP